MAGDIILSPVWLLGFLLITFLPIPFDFLAFQLASQSLIVPLGSMSIVFTMINAPWITKEKVTRVDMIAAGIIVFGCIVTTLTGSHASQNHTELELANLFLEPAFLILEMTFLIIGLMCYIAVITNPKNRESSTLQNKLQPVFFAYLCAMNGSLQNVVFKSVSELSNNSSSFSSYLIYICAVSAIFLAIMQLNWLNKGLAIFKGTVYLPIYNTAQILLSTAIGRYVILILSVPKSYPAHHFFTLAFSFR